MYWQSRTGDPYWNMQYAFRGHMVVLVEPGIVIDNLPRATFGGEDAQLRAAIAHLEALIREDPREVPPPPPYPRK